MESKELGSTGVELSEIGIGTYQYKGGPELFRRAIDLGIDWIDTAEHYRNEELVGEALRGIRDRVFIATKTHHFRHDEVMQCAEASLRKLGTDRIDLYQLHWPNAAVPLEETFGALEKLVDQGKVRFLGISNFVAGETRRVFSALRSHRLVSNQLRYSLVERTIQPRILPFCLAHDMSVLAYSPLGHRYRYLEAADHRGVLKRIANEQGRTMAQVALNWCTSQPGVLAITKTESIEHLEENVQASGWRLGEAEMDALSRGVTFRRRSAPEAFLRRLARDTRERIRARQG